KCGTRKHCYKSRNRSPSQRSSSHARRTASSARRTKEDGCGQPRFPNLLARSGRTAFQTAIHPGDHPMTDSTPTRKFSIWRFLLRFLFVMILLALIVVGAYFALPYLYRELMTPVQDTSTRLTGL